VPGSAALPLAVVFVSAEGVAASIGSSPSSASLNACMLVAPQMTLAPHRTLKPCVVLAPQMTELPQRMDLLSTKTELPQMTELPHRTELFQTDEGSLDKVTVPVSGL
jgi:hypothetical protein